MSRLLHIGVLAVALAALQPLMAGSITGVVRAEGKQGADEAGGAGNYSSKALKGAERINYEEMRDFVVYIKGPVPGAKLARPLEAVHQKNATFVPHVLPVMIGTAVEFPNDDNIFHNVFSKSDARPFDLGLYKKGDPPHQVTFTNLGEVDVFCSIHSRMSCIILVLENPYYAVTDSRGRYSITNVPAGTYTLVAWQERLPADSRVITVPESGDGPGVNFTLGPKNLPKF
jgi:plastocyanin